VKCDINGYLDKWGVHKYVNATVKEIVEEGVVIADAEGNSKILPCDQIVVATGRDPYKPLEAPLKEAGVAYTVIGDANGHHEAGEAMREAFLLCRDL